MEIDALKYAGVAKLALQTGLQGLLSVNQGKAMKAVLNICGRMKTGVV